MADSCETVYATVRAASIWIDAVREGNIGRVILDNDAFGRVLKIISRMSGQTVGKALLMFHVFKIVLNMKLLEPVLGVLVGSTALEDGKFMSHENAIQKSYASFRLSRS